MIPTTRRTLRIAGLIGIAAAFLAAIADVTLLYNPDGGYGSGTYNYLGAVPPNRLMLGHFLGVLILPFEIAGLWQLSRAIEVGARKTAIAFLLISIYSVILGTVFHAALAPIGLLVQTINAAPPATTAPFLVLLEDTSFYARTVTTLLNVGVLVSSLLFAWAVAFRPTLYPRWFAAFNFFLVVLVVLGVASILPVLGNLIFPAAFSVASFIIFTLSTILLWNRPTE